MVLDNLKFWKKKDDEMFINDDLKRPIEGVDETFEPTQEEVQPERAARREQRWDDFAKPDIFREPPQQGKDFTVRDVKPQQQYSDQRAGSNEELILAKLDAIKAMVENLGRRIERIEEIALKEERKARY